MLRWHPGCSCQLTLLHRRGFFRLQGRKGGERRGMLPECELLRAERSSRRGAPGRARAASVTNGPSPPRDGFHAPVRAAVEHAPHSGRRLRPRPRAPIRGSSALQGIALAVSVGRWRCRKGAGLAVSSLSKGARPTPSTARTIPRAAAAWRSFYLCLWVATPMPKPMPMPQRREKPRPRKPRGRAVLPRPRGRRPLEHAGRRGSGVLCPVRGPLRTPCRPAVAVSDGGSNETPGDERKLHINEIKNPIKNVIYAFEIVQGPVLLFAQGGADV